jgi:hypothetical protein
MTIALKGDNVIIASGKVATNCQCCPPPDNCNNIDLSQLTSVTFTISGGEDVLVKWRDTRSSGEQLVSFGIYGSSVNGTYVFDNLFGLDNDAAPGGLLLGSIDSNVADAPRLRLLVFREPFAPEFVRWSLTISRIPVIAYTDREANEEYLNSQGVLSSAIYPTSSWQTFEYRYYDLNEMSVFAIKNTSRIIDPVAGVIVDPDYRPGGNCTRGIDATLPFPFNLSIRDKCPESLGTTPPEREAAFSTSFLYNFGPEFGRVPQCVLGPGFGGFTDLLISRVFEQEPAWYLSPQYVFDSIVFEF